MVPYIIKSSLCLAILYGFYYIFLRNIKVFEFNRYFLLFALVFSSVIPCLTFPALINLTVPDKINEFATSSVILVQKEVINTENTSYFSLKNICLVLYLAVSSILLIRFLVNISKIIIKIRRNLTVDEGRLKIVLVNNQDLPYSFFKYIFINRSEFENGKIEKVLLNHEKIHCQQYHSMDILFIELLKIVLWFNPLLWMYRKAIHINHEYIADNGVLVNHDLEDYLNTLTSLAFRNNSIYLASNLNYSLTKKRLIMMTKNSSPGKSTLTKIAALSMFLLLAITFAFSQKTEQLNIVMNFENEWWSPILKRHNIEPSGFNNFEHVFEMGTKNSIENRIAHLENAFFLIRSTNDEYIILKCRTGYHELDKNIIVGTEGTYETYSLKSKELKPIESFSFKEIKYDLNSRMSAQSSQLDQEEKDQLTFQEEQKAAEIDQKLAEEEQKQIDQSKLYEEQKAAEVDQKLAQQEQKKLSEEQIKISEEQKAAALDQKLLEEELKIRLKEQLKLSEEQKVLLDN